MEKNRYIASIANNDPEGDRVYLKVVRIDGRNFGIESDSGENAGPSFKSRKAAEDAIFHLWGSPLWDLQYEPDYSDNPAPRIGTKKPLRKSQVTKKPPTKRLVTRRKKNAKKGYFPNPKALAAVYTVTKADAKTILHACGTLAAAKKWAQAYATKNKCVCAINKD